MTRSDQHHGPSVPRYLAILVAAVLGLALFPATALADHNPDGEDPCEDAPVANQYVDRDEAREVHRGSIDCAVFRSLALGTSDTTYSPGAAVERDQMATFIYNTLSNAGYELPETGGEPEFNDIAGNNHEGTINSLARAGIIRGTSETGYSPNLVIRRDQMASFIVQAANWAVGDEHPVARDEADRFDPPIGDVSEENPHKGNIEAGTDSEPPLFNGVSANEFHPDRSVLRDQMATFLVNLFSYVFSPDNDIEPTTVALDADEVEQGGTVTGTIESADSATVSGCGFDDEDVTDNDGDDDNDAIEFELAIADDATAGECTLTFTIVRPNGQTVNRSVTITVEEDTTEPNADFNVSPAGDQSDETGGGDLDFTVTGITSGTVDIALVSCAGVDVDDDDVVSFGDDENTDADADLEGNNEADDIDAANDDTAAFFSQVNGAAAPAGEQEYLNDVNVVNGAVTFSVNSNELGCVRAVIFDDADDDNALDLDENNQPSEAFAVTGELTFTAPAATTSEMDENVQSVDKANNRFVGCELTNEGGQAGATGTESGAGDLGTETVDSADCDQFTYDDNDEFFIDRNNDRVGDNNEQATLAEFEAALSPDDDVAGDYNANASLRSSFILFDEAPTPPEAVTATATNNSVTLTIDDSATRTVDSYNVYRAAANAGDCPDPATGRPPMTASGGQNAFTLVGNVADPSPNADSGNATFTDNTVAANTVYCYQVTSVDDGAESADATAATGTASTGANGEVTTQPTPAADTTAPLSRDVELTTNAGFQNRLTNGDVIKACFNEALAAPTAGDAIVIEDPDGDTAELTNGQNATFALGGAATGDVSTGTGANSTQCPANQTLVITLTADPADGNPGAGANDGIQLPAEITDQSGNTDVAGNQWNVAGSPDTTIDEEDELEENDLETGDNTDPTMADATGTAAQQITVTYTENVCGAAGAGAAGTTPTSASPAAGGACGNVDPSQFVFTPTAGFGGFEDGGQTTCTPFDVTDDQDGDDTTIVLVFATAAETGTAGFPAAGGCDFAGGQTGSLDYTDPTAANDVGDVIDRAGNAAPNETEAVDN